MMIETVGCPVTYNKGWGRVKPHREHINYVKLLVFESVAFTQQPGSDSAPPAWWHGTEVAARLTSKKSFSPGLSFRPALWSNIKQRFVLQGAALKMKKKEILLRLIIYGSIECRWQKLILHLSFRVFRELPSLTMNVSLSLLQIVNQSNFLRPYKKNSTNAVVLSMK